jgi:hypothetical protein
MLVVVAEPVHILVPTLAVSHTASERAEPAFSLPFNLPQLTLRDRVILVTSSLSSRALARKQRLYLLKILRRCKVAAPVCHVILEPVSLLVALVTVGLRTPERF